RGLRRAHGAARPRPRHRVAVAEGLAGTVAVVGFPNVGKSTLVNRLTGSRPGGGPQTPRGHPAPHARHPAAAGGTRDRKELVCEWAGTQFLLIATGGVDIAAPSPITRSIADQARAAVQE